MVEHIIADVQDLSLVEIYPDGSCFLACVQQFLKRSRFSKFRTIAKGGISKLGIMCLRALCQDVFVKELQEVYAEELLKVWNLATLSFLVTKIMTKFHFLLL